MIPKFNGMTVSLGGYEAKAVFPINIKSTGILPGIGKEQSVHMHFDIELHFVLSGSYSLVTENCQIRLPQSSMCIVPKGVVHVTQGANENSRSFNMLLTLRAVRTNDSGKNELRRRLSVWERVQDIQVFEECERINEYVRDFIAAANKGGEVGKYMMRSIMTLLLFAITEKIEQRYSYKSLLANACSINYAGEFFDAELESFLMTNYRRKLLRQEVAEHIGISVAQLGRVLRRNYGMSYNELITALRMSEAKKLLSLDKTLAEIAKGLGYTTYNGFSAAFYRSFGKTPEQMRKEIKK